MGKHFRALGLALVTLVLNGCATPAHPHAPPIDSGRLVDLEVYDRTHRTTLPAYTKDGRRYIVGTPGHEYAVRIRNRTPGRVLVVTSVDGVNVISGDTAAPSQSGYVLDPWGSVEIIGWRKSLERTAAFFFTDLQNSYAARTGRPDNVGVIGVAVFREKPRPVARLERDFRAAPAPAPLANAPAAGASQAESTAKAEDRIGTGHGRNEASPVRLVTFERISESPSDTIVVQYDKRENLVAMGVLPTTPRVTRTDPNPFPASVRFAPDPR